ncbi:MAG: 50S ribosomal protein L11 methyltransferase, partial [Clostridia bacterium]
MTYREITVNTTTEASELVADILSQLGSKGVGIYDSNDYLELKKEDVMWDYVDDSLLVQNKVVAVKGYFEVEICAKVLAELNEQLEFLKENCPFEYGSLEVIVRDVDDEDWVNVWKENYKPIHAGKLTIVPNWIDYKAKDDEVVVRMDPGMAFGTGEHESTKMCLLLMQALDMSRK